MLVLLMLSACQPDLDTGDPVDSDPLSWETCTDFRMVLAQALKQESLPERSSPSKGWPGVAIGDFTGDGRPDVLMAYGGGSTLFLGDGSGTLVEDTGATLDGEPLPRARAVAAADVDSDGDLDAVLVPYDEGELQILMLNDGGGRFDSLLLPDSGFITWTPSFGDLDGDGLLDLYLATYTATHEVEPIMAGEVQGSGHAVYFQQADGRFLRDDTALPAEIDPGLSLLGALLDADGDGDLDVYMTNDFGPFVLPNRLLLNDGTGHFSVDPDCSCELAIYAMGTAVGDADDDGDPDLYVTNVGSPRFLTNTGDGSFVDDSLTRGTWIEPTDENMTSWGTVFLDANQDACQDLLVVYGGLNSDGQLVMDHESGGEWTEQDLQRDVLLLSDCDGGFTRAPDEVFTDNGRGRAVAIGDLNQDGRPDAVIVGKHYLNVWLAEGGCPPGVSVRLDAGPGNRQGIGARVSVSLGERTSTQWMLPGTTASSSEHALFFGYGGRPHADSVTITWPDGEQQVVADVPAGTQLSLAR